MKHRFLSFGFSWVLILFFLNACVEDKCERVISYKAYVPEYISMEEFRTSFKAGPARELCNPRKIYYHSNGYTFINEVDEGVHVIDNRDPRNPQTVSFIEAIGNRDMLALGNYLYLDSHMDFLVVDISDPVEPKLVRRIPDIFPYRPEFNGFWADPSRGIVKAWNEEDIVETVDCNTGGGGWWRGGAIDFATNDLAVPQAEFNNGAGGEQNGGQGGSMARFTRALGHLYAVTDAQLLVFDLEDITHPQKVSDSYIGWEIETIFPYKDHLFIGSRSAMHIYNITTPTEPHYVSQFSHARNCDPVVVEGDYAYVTLRSGNPICDGFQNQLDVVNISNISNPWLVKTYPMTNPHGLGIRDDVLFLCDGEDGLKVYDAKDKTKISENQLAHFKNIHAFDAIPLHHLLLMIGEDGFYQYDYSDLSDIKLLSVLPVKRQ